MQHLRPRAGGAGGARTEFFVSGAGGYELHPRLKADADGARPAPAGDPRRFVSTLNDEVEELFSRAAFGFMSVSIEGDGASVTAFEVGGSLWRRWGGGGPVVAYETALRSNRSRRRTGEWGDGEYSVFDATSAYAELEL